jgi:hypothetical protein
MNFLGMGGVQKALANAAKGGQANDKPPAPNATTPSVGKASGGPIQRVSGKPVGKDDGMIPAKRGEYVVKKSSTTKYGPAKMAAVNRGTAKVTRGKR